MPAQGQLLLRCRSCQADNSHCATGVANRGQAYQHLKCVNSKDGRAGRDRLQLRESFVFAVVTQNTGLTREP